MPAPSVPRLLGSLVTVGLATAALGVWLAGAPLLANAAPTPTPTTTAPSPSTEEPSGSSPSPKPTTQSPTSTPAGEAESDDPEDGPTDSDDAAGGDNAATNVESGTAAASDSHEQSDATTPSAERSASDQVLAQAEGPADISLTKTASLPRVSKVGQVITYTFVATNTGTVALDNVRISDDLDGLSEIGCTGSALPQRGDAVTCRATLTVTQDWLDFGDIDNSATVFGDIDIVGDDSEEVDYVSANASAHVSVDQKPSISLDASVSPTGTADAGDRLRYSATATNTGNVTLTAARITSSLDALDLDCDPSARATLAPGASIDCSGSYKVTGSDARRGRVSNLLTARADAPYGDDITDDTRLRVAVNKPPADDSDTGLADTGGPGGALPVGALGAAALLLGGGLVRRGLRR